MPPARVRAALKDEILGADYDLSFSLIGTREARQLHRRFMADDTPANVLSFPFSPSEGEILIHNGAKNKFELFIHGLFHLKGYAHGSKMERAEKNILDGQKYRRWVGLGNFRHQARRR